MNRHSLVANIDYWTILIYLMLVIIGISSIYSASYDIEDVRPVYSLSVVSGKQILWFGFACCLIILIMLLDYKLFETFSYILYGFVVLLLAAVLVVGKEVGGARAWFDLGFIRLQPTEFAKLATALALARFLSKPGVSLKDPKSYRDTILRVLGILGLPALLILLQPDPGSLLVFGSFLLMLYREGLNKIYLLLPIDAALCFVLALVVKPLSYLAFTILIIGAITLGVMMVMKKLDSWKKIVLILVVISLHLAFVFSVSFLFENILKPHQKERINIVLGMSEDVQGRGQGYNLKQSKIAIGSGGVAGKGYLQGTQTKYNFVPEQHTDFIFCTIGEETGFLGSALLIILYIALMSRIIIISERQKDSFVRIYGYGVAGIFFFHFMINISMTMGLFPVVGIPLPFISYGGSSLWSFTVLLFVLVKLDSHRNRLFAG